MPEFEIVHTFSPRPEGVPKDAIVFNAPRPIHGFEEWRGKLRHGRYYTAITLDASCSSFMLRNLHDLGAVVIQYHGADEIDGIRAEVQAYCDDLLQERIDVSEHDDRTALLEWRDHVAPKTVKLEVPDDEQ